ncbi:MAG: GFA family protein [Alphaproteobacteria bacterium]|jgi:hypothetical protein|nr:GFA family protein [Alphaproteobacteria bacterium]MBO6863305.1 GFA family protein [Alphaproteobacteria bacterium]
MRMTGRCHCGGIEYEADIDPQDVIVCHCTDCQTLSGSAYRTVAFTAPDGLTLLKGEPAVYVKIADSGRERQQSFCPTCGTPIYSAPNAGGPKVYGVRVGTLDNRRELVPSKQYYCGSRLDWLPLMQAEDIGGDV